MSFLCQHLLHDLGISHQCVSLPQLNSTLLEMLPYFPLLVLIQLPSRGFISFLRRHMLRDNSPETPQIQILQIYQSALQPSGVPLVHQWESSSPTGDSANEMFHFLHHFYFKPLFAEESFSVDKHHCYRGSHFMRLFYNPRAWASISSFNVLMLSHTSTHKAILIR